jgi:hypothetical protein
MKHKFSLGLIGIFFLVLCVSCGQTVKETITPVVPAGGQFTRVVIVPFADHTPESSLYDHCRRNTLVLEALQDALYKAGFIPAAQEDVVKHMVDKGVIKEFSGGSAVSDTSVLDKELQGGWSDEMKEEIREVIYQEIVSNKSAGDQANRPVAMDRETLKDLGSAFGADYVIRGRIIEFGTDQQDTFNPIRTGLIPFVFKSSLRTGFGVAETETYEYIDVDKDEIKEYDQVRDLFWGGGAFVTGLIGEKQGQVPGATVQIRLLVQDVRTGNVLWLNRAETCSIPRTAYADPDSNQLIKKAIEQTVNSLVSDFASAEASGRLAISDKGPRAGGEAVVSDYAAAQAEKAAKEAKEAAARAEEAAKKASEATSRSEKIFKKALNK